MFGTKGGVVQQPKYKEVDTDYIPSSTGRGRGGGGRGRGRRVHHSHSLEDEASLYYVIRNNRSSLTVRLVLVHNCVGGCMRQKNQ